MGQDGFRKYRVAAAPGLALCLNMGTEGESHALFGKIEERYKLVFKKGLTPIKIFNTAFIKMSPTK